MKSLKLILSFGICMVMFNGVVFSQQSEDTIIIEKERIAQLIKPVEKRLKLKKNYPKKEIFYEYPSEIEKGAFFTITVLWKEEVLFIIDFDPVTFEIKEIIDWR